MNKIKNKSNANEDMKLMEKEMRRIIGKQFRPENEVNIWNFIFGILGTIFLIWGIVEESSIKLGGAIVFFILSAMSSLNSYS